MEIILNGSVFVFDDSSELLPKDSPYDLELVEPGFDRNTEGKCAGGVDSVLELPIFIERTISRTSEMPVAKIFVDKNGKKRLDAYFD